MNQQEACTVPESIAVCPICGEPIWIEDIQEVEEDGDRLLPTTATITCSTEPDVDSDEWPAWHDGHFSTPYIDWLPIKNRILNWLEQPEQQNRVQVIWNDE